MNHTRDDSVHDIIPFRAAGYRRDRDGGLLNSALMDTSNKIPGGGLCGTVGDILAFAEAFEDGRLVAPENVDRMSTRQRLATRMPTPYGLGWFVNPRHGRREVYHTGSQPSVSGLLYMRPEAHVAIALLCNLEGADLIGLARQIADELETAHPGRSRPAGAGSSLAARH
jgi:hypothetical protein